MLEESAAAADLHGGGEAEMEEHPPLAALLRKVLGKRS
jgi:hypothetical protein